MEEILRTLGERIRRLREQAGLTQEHLAEKVNLHGSYVGLIERGKKAPSLYTLMKIADFFNLAISDLLVTNEAWHEKDMEGKRIMEMLKGRSEEDSEKIRRIIEIFLG